MKCYICVALGLLMALAAPALRKGKGGAVRKMKNVEVVEDPRIAQMLSSVQQVVFIDSMVVDADTYMSHIPLSPYSGRLSQDGTFTNEMGDRRLATNVVGGDTTIVSSDFIANRWTTPTPLDGIGDGAAVNPFLMPDGVTLYFAQKGEKSIGGFDIFVTRYNSERGTFLKPENIGMPFASEANDLFYAIDEFNQLGWFVTDRRQPQGKVCIYVFIPEESHHAYPSEAYSNEQLRALAAISRIADTWPASPSDRQQAMARLTNARNRVGTRQTAMDDTQTSELDTLRHQAEVLDKSIELARNYYATASDDERSRMREQLIRDERQLEMLLTEIRKKEKLIPYQ